MMSKIHISRDRQSLGHFFPGEVAVGLRTGRFLPSDMAWQDPMETWKPLAEFTDLPVIEEEPEALPSVAEGAAPAVPDAEPSEEPAWEQPGMAGLFGKLYTTIVQVFSRPATTFRGLNPDGSIVRAFVYYLVLSTFSFWVSLGYFVLVILLVPGYLEKSPLGGKMTPTMAVVGSVINAIIAPFFLAGLAFVAAGFLHLVHSLFGVAVPNFSVTVRVFCYAVGTASLMMLIPNCGAVIFLGISIMLLIVGLKEAYRTDFVRPAIAVIVPAVTLLVLYVLLIIATGLVM